MPSMSKRRALILPEPRDLIRKRFAVFPVGVCSDRMPVMDGTCLRCRLAAEHFLDDTTVDVGQSEVSTL